MYSVQNEHKPKSRMKDAEEEDFLFDEINLNANNQQQQPTTHSIASNLSDLTDLNSRTNSLLDYASSGQLSNNSKMHSVASKAMQKAQDYRAKVITFYMNGDPFKAIFRVTIMKNRDFQTFNKLLDHLTDRTKLPIKFVFDLDGKRLTSVDDFEHSMIYICSTTNKFYQAQYGAKSLKSNFRTTNFSDIRPFLRPLSSKNKYNNRSTGSNSNNSSDSSLENKLVNGVIKKEMINKNLESEEVALSDTNKKSVTSRGARFIKGKVVTIINRKLPSKSSRVLLNLRSARTFEYVVKDLGESVSLPMARILLTQFGNEIRSISQLRRSLNEIDTFFVDDLQLETIEDWNRRNTNDSSKLNSIENKQQEMMNRNPETVEMNENKDELIKKLSLAANSSEELNKKNDNDSSINDRNSNRKGNKMKVSPKPGKIEELNKNLKGNSSKIMNNLSANHNAMSNMNEQETDLKNYQTNELNNNESPEVANNQLHNQFNGPSNSEPNSINNSRNSLLDETNSFSNSVSPDQTKDNSIQTVRTPTPITPSNNQLNKMKQSNKQALNQQLNENSQNNKIIKPYEAQLVEGVKVPQRKFKLKKIFGYNGDVIGSNLFVLSTGEIAYYVGIFVVLYDPIQNLQRHYSEHTEDICCMNVDHKNELVVSVQKGNDQENQNTQPIVKVWNYKSLETLFSVQNFESCSANILSVVFSKSSFLLVLALFDGNIQFYYYDWKNNRLIAKLRKLLKNEEIYGLIFHPFNDHHFMSFGKRHLNHWILENNELIAKKTFKHILKGNGSCITSLTFLEDCHLIAGDSDGLIFVWTSVFNEICEFDATVNEIKAHDSTISAILAFPNRYIVTGDITGVLKTWTYDNSTFSILNVTKLPAMSGAIRSLTFASDKLLTDPDYFRSNIDNEKLYKIYIGTSTNLIFSGSALQATQYIVLYEGHSFGIRAIAVDSVEKNWFYTSGIDHKICKWSKNLLLWCVRCKYQCTSMAVYPGGETLAVGCSNGIICIISTTSSEFITQISLSNSAIGCLAYSPDSMLMAAGSENGQISILPVFNQGNSYDRISALKCNYPILSLQWSMDCKNILTSINDNDFQEILLWNLNSSNFVKGVSIMSEKIKWYDANCLSGDDVRGIWVNENLENVINLCCHCSSSGDLLVTGDENGNIRLFTYPCLDKKSSFYLAKQSSNAVTEARFLKDNNFLVTSAMEGSIFLWELI